jgi:small subunit ribosomal protein S17
MTMADKKTKASASKGKTPAKAGGPKSVPPRAAAEAARAAGPLVLPSSELRKSHSFRRKMIGVITSDKMDKTVVVEVIRKAMDPVYKKYIRVRERYKAHDEKNEFKSGDQVEIQEHRPLSATKRWLVTRLINRPVEA